MTIHIKYFGQAGEIAGTDRETIDIPAGLNACGLKDFLKTNMPAFDSLSFQVAVNQELNSDGELHDGDEIAVLPPFAGG